MDTMKIFSIPIIYIFIAAAFIVPKIPIIGKFFNIINTTIHEFGHALMTLLVDGKVEKIEIFHDSSGVTVTRSKSKLGSFLIALSGYPFAAAMGYLLIFMNRAGYEKGVICGLSLLFFIMLILWIRNIYGFIWTILFIALNVFLLYYNHKTPLMIVAHFYAITIVVESVSSSLTVLYLSAFRSSLAGDATNLQQITHIPAFFWGVLFCAASCFVAFLCMKPFFL